MSSTTGLYELRVLAALYGVQTAYYGVDHQLRSASVESLLAVLQGLGASVSTPRDAPMALRERTQQLCRQVVEPVTVAWDGRLEYLPVRLSRKVVDSPWWCHLTLESGEQESWKCSGLDSLPGASAIAEGVEYVVTCLPWAKELPEGYHRLILEIPGVPPVETLIISAPSKAYSPFDNGGDPTWGVFLPLYALRRDRNAILYGDFSDLAALTQWVGSLGGGIVATLPILPSFLDEPFEPSPYAPVSRLLWNEFYIDLSQVPELENCQPARAILSSEGFARETESLRNSPLVDYRKGMQLKRQVLEALAWSCFNEALGHAAALEGFLGQHPVVEDYARFRATIEKRGDTWPAWPQRLREGTLTPADYDEDVKQYHTYVQWVAHQQVQELSRKGGEYGAELYLDLPLGVHPEGFDVWSHQDLFAGDFSVGAPPDAFFSKGQDWGFPPLQPEALRQSGYDYFRSYLRHHLEVAGTLRIDHVMGLHRLFWVPQGTDASQGVYVGYRSKEFYAILALESHRNKAAIVGEDLGTVPPLVRPAMRDHGIYRMYVAYFEMSDNPQRALRSVPPGALASTNTHDMPPFAAFWAGQDIGYRQELGHQSEEGARQELKGREIIKEALLRFLQHERLLQQPIADPRAVLDAILRWLGQSQAPMVLVNLEDLWLETQPQNIPGTGPEQPNWQHPANYSFGEFSQMPQVVEVLRELDSLRKLARHRR